MNTLRILAPAPTLRCTGPRTKAHFTFKTSQGKLQNHRLIITLLLSQQLAPWFPATNLLIQTGWPPHCSTSVSCSYSQWYSGCLSLSSLQIPPLSGPTASLMPLDGSSLWGFLPLGTLPGTLRPFVLVFHWHWKVSCRSAWRFSNKLWPWANKSPKLSMLHFTHLQSGGVGNKSTQVFVRIRWVHTCEAFRPLLPRSW